MSKDFIKLFHDLSKSVDIVDDRHIDDMKNVLRRIADSMNASFCEVQTAKYEKGSTKIKLETFWASVIIPNNEGDDVIERKGEKFEGKGQAAYAFTNNKSIWITNANKKSLSIENYKDSWPGTIMDEKIPPFWDVNAKYLDYDPKTSIIVLLRNIDASKAPIGIVNFEFSEFIQYSRSKRSLFENIADSISIFIQLERIRTIQSKNTNEILNNLNDPQKNLLAKLLGKPKIFVAYPSRCEKDVIEYIKEYSEKYENIFDFKFWDSETKPGNIDISILDMIKESKYGIAYFSEKRKIDDNTEYIDNLNVIFEAGMFHALKNDDDKSSLIEEWIPIREESSKEPPCFDIAHERIFLVDRFNDGQIKIEFKKKLDKVMEKWIIDNK